MYPQSVQVISVLPEFLAAPTGRKFVKEEISTSLTSLRSREMEVEEAKMKMRMKVKTEVEMEGPRPDRVRCRRRTRTCQSRGAVCVDRLIWRGSKVSTITTPTVTTSPR